MEREYLARIVADSKSYREVVLRLGWTGGSAWHKAKRLIADYGLDVTHFQGQGANSGANHRGGPIKITPENVHLSTARLGSSVVRRVLRESGRKYECEKCGNIGMWNEKPLQLEVDHIDGNRCNCALMNLRYLCPNCHALTGTHGFQGRKHTDETRRRISEKRRKH